MEFGRKKKVLLVDDDECVHLANKYVLKPTYDCRSAYHGEEAKVLLAKERFDILLLDLNMRYENEGLDYIPFFKELDPDMDIVVMSSNSEVEFAAKAVRRGACGYLMKELAPQQMLLTLEVVTARRALIHENTHHKNVRVRSLERNSIVGSSRPLKKLLGDIEKVRNSTANVVIYAETGCGKELVARHIGELEARPFVTVDSATISHGMAESILFGHEKGAFTGADKQARGLFEEANGGTIFFDEIANMPLDIQAKLLRVFQEKEIIRVGSSKRIPLEFRVICATNQDLERMCTEGKFKADLLQRLSVITLTIPPLRDRKEDIRPLVEHMWRNIVNRDPSYL